MNFKNFSKFASIALLVIALVVCLVPMTASAASNEVIYGADKTYQSTGSFTEAIEKANSVPGDTVIYIKLNGNVSLDKVVEIGSSAKVEIDLYGKTISPAAGKNIGIFDVKGQLTITDSSASQLGKITGAVASAVNVNGSGSIFTLKSGNISGNNVSGNGGAVYVGVGASFVMEGGKIHNNNAAGQGGGVYSEGNVYLRNGIVQIVNNFSGGTVSAGGVASGYNKSNLCLANGSAINASALQATSSVGISAAVAPSVGSYVLITNPATEDCSKYFTSDNSAYGLISIKTTANNATTYVIRLEPRNIAFGEYVGGPLVSFVANNSSNRLKVELTTSGFAESSTVSVKWCDADGKALTTSPTGLSAMQASRLANGKVSIEFASTSSLRGGDYYYKVVIDGYESTLQTISVASASITKNNVTTYYKTLAEAVAAAVDGDTINILDSHTIKGSVTVSGKSITLASPSSTKTLTFIDGGINIVGGSLTVNATNASRTINFAGDAERYVDYSLINVSGSGSTLTLKYSTISDGRALNNGGGIYLDYGAKADLTNVTINKCVSLQGDGGAIYAGASSTLSLSGVKITDCSAVRGGAIYVASGATATAKGGTSISGCKAPGESGSASAAGGAIYNAGSFELNASTISSCKSTVSGGAIYHVGSKLVVTSASKIIDCSATAYGGAIYLASGKLQINDSAMSGCTSNAGDGIYMGSGATVDLFGRVVLDEIYMTSSSNYIDVSGVLSSDSFMSVYTASHYSGSTLVRSAGNHTLSAADAKRIRLSGEVTSYSLKYVSDASGARVELSNQALAVGRLEGGTLSRGTAATGLYYIGEAHGIANGVRPTITWYSDKYMTSAGSGHAPSGVTFTVGAVNGSSFTINVTSGTSAKAGNYYFTVTAEGIESGLNTLTIKRTAIKKPSVNKVYTYTGQEQTLELENFNAALMSFVSGHKAKDVGSYGAVIALSDKTQYEWIDGSDGNITVAWMIERAKLPRPTITTACTYKGAEQSPVINGWKENIMTATGNKQTKVGKYTLTVTLKDTKNYMWDNYSTGSITLEWEIKKAELVVKANDVNLVYGDAPKNNGVTYTTLLGTDTAASLKGTLVYTQNYTQGANAGTYTITPSGLTSDNYDIKFQSGSVIVDKKPVELVWSNLTFTYDGQAHIPSVAYKSYTGTEKLAVSGAQVKAGKHTATATGFSHVNYKLANPTVEFEIKKVELTVKAKDAIITYGDPLSTINPGYTVSGFVAGETESVLGGSVTYSTNYVLYGDVGGSFTVTPAGLTSDNYSFNYVNGNLSVKKRVVKVAADTIYSADGNDKMTYTIVEGSFVNGDEKYLALARSDGMTPGKYAIAGSLANGNYEFAFTPASYYILSYSVAVKGNNHGVIIDAVDGIDPELSAGVTPAEVKDYKKIDTEGKPIAVYKIVFEKNGAETAPEGRIKITIPFDEKYAGDELIIKRIDANGTATALNTTVNGNTLQAEILNTDANAAYAIYTYESSSWIWWVIGGVALVAVGVGVFIFISKRNTEYEDDDEDEDEDEDEDDESAEI